MSDDHAARARDLAARLREEGHAAAADRLQETVDGPHIGTTLLHGLRDACHFVLTAIEALDPKTTLMAEELRIEVDKRLL